MLGEQRQLLLDGLEFGISSFKTVTDVGQDFDEQDDDHGSTAKSRKIDAAADLGLEIQEHDDEQEKHHDRSGIDQDLDYADKISVEGDVKRR